MLIVDSFLDLVYWKIDIKQFPQAKFSPDLKKYRVLAVEKFFFSFFLKKKTFQIANFADFCEMITYIAREPGI